MAALLKTRTRASAPRDEGLDEIRAWHEWFVDAHQRRLAALHLPTDQHEGALDAIIAIAASIRERMTSEYPLTAAAMKPDKLADLLIDHTTRVLSGPKVNGRFTALEARLTALEARPHVKFCGPWADEKVYSAGDAVVFQGGLWVCRSAETTGRPNQAFHAWTLAVKSRSIA